MFWNFGIRRGSELGLVFSAICTKFLVFAVKLDIFLMFAVSEESTVKCLEGSSDIFGNGRTSSFVLGNLRQSSELSVAFRNLLK